MPTAQGNRCLTVFGLFVAMVITVNIIIYNTLESQSHPTNYNFGQKEMVHKVVERKQSEEERPAERPVHTPGVAAPVAPAQFDKNQPKFVVVLTYHRSGSSFTGQLFNANPGAYFLYEPLDALYAALYGTVDGWTVPTDITSYSNGSRRIVPRREVDAVTKHLQNLLYCDLKAVPTQMLMHNYWNIHSHQFTACTEYIHCTQTNNLTYPACKDFNPWRCNQRFGRVESEQQLKECNVLLRDDHITTGPYGAFLTCLREKRQLLDEKCTHILENTCNSHGLRVVKTTRATMTSVEPLLRDNPSLRVIHAIRDPRAVAQSRMTQGDTQLGLYSTVATDEDEQMYREAKMFCRTLAADIITRRELESKYPGRIHTSWYDDLAVNLQRGVTDIYRFLDEPVPKEITKWIYESNDKSARISGGWKKRLSPEQMNRIAQECSEFCSVINNCDWIIRR